MADQNDPFAGKEWRRFEDRVRKELIPKLDGSAASVSLVPDGKGDVKFAVELGFSIMLDKPIIAVVAPGVNVSRKMRMVADRVIVGQPGDEGFEDQLMDALRAIIPGVGRADG